MIHEAGGPEKFLLQELPVPSPRKGWVTIRIRAFGLNRSEWFTRRGDSPTVQFPRVLGIECVGEVLDSGGSSLVVGQKVAAIMGGMGRQFHGSYAEITQVPESSVFPVSSSLAWERLGALPEMLQTVHGSLFVGLEIDRAESLLIRGGTSSIGLMALALAKSHGLKVASTTRSARSEEMLRQAGADEVWVDDGKLSAKLEKAGQSYDRVLELLGAGTLLDSLRCVRRGGIVCMTGILGGEWVLNDFHPMGDVPTGVKLTSYSGEAADLKPEQLESYLKLVESGKLQVKTGPVFDFEELPQAHALMDENLAGGKIVVRGPQ